MNRLIASRLIMLLLLPVCFSHAIGPLCANLLGVQLTHLMTKDLRYLYPKGGCNPNADWLIDFSASPLLKLASASTMPGMVYWVNGDCRAAAREWEELTSAQPAHSIGWFWQGVANAFRGETRSAAQAIQKASAERQIARLALQAYDEKDITRTRMWLSVAGQTPMAFPSLKSGVLNMIVQDRLADALELWRAYVASLPVDEVQYWWALGWIERFIGSPDVAVGYLDVALRLSANEPDLLDDMLLALLAKGDHERALSVALQMVQSSSDRGFSRLRVAQVYEAMKDYDRAIEWLMRAREISPQSWAIQNELAVASCSNGQVGVALEYFDQALQLLPSGIYTMMARTQCLYRSGRIIDAMDYAEETIRHHGTDPRLVNFCLELGEWYMQEGKVKSAEDVYQLGLERWPQVKTFKDRLDEIYQKAH
jgi:tetratricopeptide (TPR) repeat protein